MASPVVEWRGVSLPADPDEISDNLARECITETGRDPLEVFRHGLPPSRTRLSAAELWWLITRASGASSRPVADLFGEMTATEARSVTVTARADPPPVAPPMVLPAGPERQPRPSLAPSPALVDGWPWLRIQLRQSMPALAARFGLRPLDIDDMRPVEARVYVVTLGQMIAAEQAQVSNRGR